jgi:hypothetical protein
MKFCLGDSVQDSCADGHTTESWSRLNSLILENFVYAKFVGRNLRDAHVGTCLTDGL